MSMIGNFRMSTDSEIQALLADPSTIEAVLYREGESGTEAGAAFDVDKAWHAIHFLLCGQPWEGQPPLNFIVSGGTPVGDVDVGYGPARVFSSSELGEIVRGLEPITAATLESRFNASAFAEHEIYPEIWDEPQADCLDGYVLHYFDLLKAFLKRAHAAGSALIVYLN